MKISVVVPYLDEARALPETLAHLSTAAALHTNTEVIAVDGGSRDNSSALLAEYPAIRILSAPCGRAVQMNAGAAAASGDVLLFLHADTHLPPTALGAIAIAASAPDFVYGGFRHRFSGDDWRLRRVSAIRNYHCAKAETFYGDQALFVRRKSFMAVGGFPQQPAEDIALSQRLRALGPPTFVGLEIVSSARKFEQMGVWTSLARALAMLVYLRAGRTPPPAFFANIR